MDSSLAESMNAQVLTIKTSASSALEVISMPSAWTDPSMISASTRFLAQPRLIIPTLVFAGADIRVAIRTEERGIRNLILEVRIVGKLGQFDSTVRMVGFEFRQRIQRRDV